MAWHLIGTKSLSESILAQLYDASWHQQGTRQNYPSCVESYQVIKSIVNIYMMTSSNGTVFRVTSLLWGESTDHGWIPLTKASDADLLTFSLICAWTNVSAYNPDAGDSRRHPAHYDVTVMYIKCYDKSQQYIALCDLINMSIIHTKSQSTNVTIVPPNLITQDGNYVPHIN